MEYIIYELENENVYLESHTGTTYTTTENITAAEVFNNETSALAVIAILPQGDSFWGTRPKRPH